MKLKIYEVKSEILSDMCLISRALMQQLPFYYF